jgi:hypothetical protein
VGNNVWRVTDHDNERLFNTRVSFDLSENVHLHYRDLRVVFGKEEWNSFAEFVAKANNWLLGVEYGENSVRPFQEIEEQLPDKSKYFDGDIVLEEQANGWFHLHLHDFRFEFTKTVRNSIINVLAQGGMYNVIPLKELFVIVYDWELGWVNLPIHQSPIYLSLFDDFVSHDFYMNKLVETFPDVPNVVSTEQYKELARSILESGFTPLTEPRVNIDENRVIDGHHRVSILLRMFGPDKKLVFKNNHLIGII